MPIAKCKHCKGEGYVYPVIEIECNSCYNHDIDKKKCRHCSFTGWVKRAVSQICMECEGTGKKSKE